MLGRPFPKPRGRRGWLFGMAAVLAAVWPTAPVRAQTPPPAGPPAGVTLGAAASVSSPAKMLPAPEGAIVPVGCSTCGGGLSGGTVSGGCGSGGCGDGRCDSCCWPGRQPCCAGCDADTGCGRFFGCLYDCICCPDPCYNPPSWLAVADSAFFTDAARPITQTRLRWDSAWDFHNPDRAEYWFARQATNPNQTIGTARGNGGPGRGIPAALHSLNFEELSLYTEGATGRVGAFVEIPYREVSVNLASFENGSKFPEQSQSGFADMTVGAKTLLLDCELMQMSFQFKTFIPIGQSSKGFGTNHVSLEPALLFALKITPRTYLQAETAYWIPIGGDDVFQANVFHSHVSLNHVLWNFNNKVQLIGTAEANLWHVFGGADTLDFRLSPLDTNVYAESGTTTIASIGPGFRLVICDKIDVGVGSAFAVTGRAWARDTIRAELRLRF